MLARPFRDAGLEAEDAAAAMARAADNYPFFLQLYGETAWGIMAATGERVLREGPCPADHRGDGGGLQALLHDALQ